MEELITAAPFVIDLDIVSPTLHSSLKRPNRNVMKMEARHCLTGQEYFEASPPGTWFITAETHIP